MISSTIKCDLCPEEVTVRQPHPGQLSPPAKWGFRYLPTYQGPHRSQCHIQLCPKCNERMTEALGLPMTTVNDEMPTASDELAAIIGEMVENAVGEALNQ
ncbi:MAG: hypothetical protein AAFN78_00905 [Pseudomonadota bacterium]